MKVLLTIVLLSMAVFSHAADCPVQIEEAHQQPVGMRPDGDWKWDLAMKYKNATDKEIQSVKFNAVLFNAVNDPIDDIDDYIDQKSTKPGKERKAMWSFGYYSRSGKAWNGFKLYVSKILFADGTEWQDDGKMSCSYRFTPDPRQAR